MTDLHCVRIWPYKVKQYIPIQRDPKVDVLFTVFHQYLLDIPIFMDFGDELTHKI